MPWHSTLQREELLLVLGGAVQLHVRRQGSIRVQPLRGGEGMFLPCAIWHQVTNDSRRPATYIYVTAPIGP